MANMSNPERSEYSDIYDQACWQISVIQLRGRLTPLYRSGHQSCSACCLWRRFGGGPLGNALSKSWRLHERMKLYGTRLNMSPARSCISMIVLQHLIVTLLFCAIDGQGKFIWIFNSYNTKIEECVCPPNISQTVGVRTVKLAHHPRIASTTIALVSKHILLSVLSILFKTI